MNKLQQFLAARPGGFISETDVPEIVAIDRLCPCLVRCGCVRFTCGAQYVKEMIAMVEKSGDYVRDVSVTAQAMERAAEWREEPRLFAPSPSPKPMSKAPGARSQPRQADSWGESQCGGVFDGFQVTSDADSGL